MSDPTPKDKLKLAYWALHGAVGYIKEAAVETTDHEEQSFALEFATRIQDEMIELKQIAWKEPRT